MKYIAILFLALSTTIGYSQEQKPFKPESKKQLRAWINEANRADEINTKAKSRLFETLEEVGESPTDPNVIYNFGRAIAKALQPGFNLQNHTFTNGALQLMIQAELAYRDAILRCDCHGRANIMLGMLYNQQQKYTLSEPYLEKGLQLKEASDDWMIAANQYLLAGAYTYKTQDEKYQAVYKKYKEYAPEHSDPYYLKMARMYIPYYEK